MTGLAAVGVALALAGLIVAAMAKRTGSAPIGGLIGKDKKGNTTLVIWPAKKKRKRKASRK